MDASHVYVNARALGRFHVHSTQSFRRALTAVGAGQLRGDKDRVPL